MARLSDLVAPPWKHQLDGVTYDMRPLSLATYAELESRGIRLSDLSKPGALDLWVRLYSFLAHDLDLEKVKAGFMACPLDVKTFQLAIQESFGGEEARQAVARHRKAVNPLKKQEEEEGELPDMSFVVTLARLSGIPISDLFRMTFRGLDAVQRSLEEMPPQPSLGGLA